MEPGTPPHLIHFRRIRDAPRPKKHPHYSKALPRYDGADSVLLSESELRAALEPLLDRLLTERLRLFQLQLEPRLQSLIARALEPQACAAAEEGFQKLLQAGDPGQCFEAIFERSREMVGDARALLVIRENQAAVWRQERVELPSRFPRSSQDLLLRAGQRLPIAVRGQTVGLLFWPGGELETTAQARLELMLQTAGLVLLSHGLTPDNAAGRPAAASEVSRTPTVALLERGGPEPASDAQRFARLLLEDLALYLQRERAQDWAEGQRSGGWQRQFQPELERCRRAFLERYPEGSGTPSSVWEEALPRLAPV